MNLGDVGKEKQLQFGGYYVDDAKVRIIMGIIDHNTGNKMFPFEGKDAGQQAKAIKGFMKDVFCSRPR